MMRFRSYFLWCGLIFLGLTNQSSRATETQNQPRAVETDLLVVGGSESAVAAAVQAARLGVRSIVLVNDINWLGGQFTSEAICAVDEWTMVQNRRAYFARSGQFLEIMQGIEQRMKEKYGLARPGNCFCAWTTCEPRETEQIFRRFVSPYLAAAGGPVTIYENYEPESVAVDGVRVSGVSFTSLVKDQPQLTVRAKLTIDASDWGDVIRLSGAEYLRGPDMKSKFNEPSAPTNDREVEPNEMNPLTYCLMLRESDQPSIIEKPAHYDVRRYYGVTTVTREEFQKLGWPAGTMGPFARAWQDSTMGNGPYGETPTVYTHRRLVDRRHNKLAAGTELVLLNWPQQDYPTYNFPQHVAEELEASEPGASKKNLVDMTPSQRRIVFQDAKDHALGLLYYLQTMAHDKEPESPVTFRNMKLTDEFGTTDKLPPKIYVREGLRLAALYMLREQDIRDTDGKQSWAGHMVPDSVFGFQFNIDFHPTRRIFLNNDPAGPWAHIHSKLRNWSTHTDRAGFPLRSMVPVKFDGLLTAGKSLGVTSIVSSAVRLHGHGMATGQAAATVAALCFEEKCQPRNVAQSQSRVRRVQTALVDPPKDAVTGVQPPGLLLWPYQDLSPDSPLFVPANQLAVRMILPGDPGEQDFHAERKLERAEVVLAVFRAACSLSLVDDGMRKAAWEQIKSREKPATETPAQDESPESLEQQVAGDLLERILSWEPGTIRQVESKANSELLAKLLKGLACEIHPELAKHPGPLTRGELARYLWHGLSKKQEVSPTDEAQWFTPDHDADGDGLPDLEDPLPADLDNDSVPDLLEAVFSNGESR